MKRSIDLFEETQKNQVQTTPYQRYEMLIYTSMHTHIMLTFLSDDLPIITYTDTVKQVFWERKICELPVLWEFELKMFTFLYKIAHHYLLPHVKQHNFD